MGHFLKKLVLFVLSPLLIFLVFMIVSREMLYDYHVVMDQTYNMDGKDALIHPLKLTNGLINFPDTIGSNHSSFIKVNVKSNGIGKMFQPHILMTGAKGSEIQYTEHGAEGIRYLNVTNLIAAGNKRIKISGDNINVFDGDVNLIQYENIDFEGKIILVLAPHPDDAEIAAFGLYSGQEDVYVVTVTSGDAGPFMYDEIYDDPVVHYLKKGEVRTWNSLTVPMLGGVHPERILNLGYNDARLKKMRQTERTLQRDYILMCPIWKHLESKIPHA